MKGMLKEGLLFFLAMNFVGMVTAIGIMIFLGKLDLMKLKDIRKIALDEATVVDTKRLSELTLVEKAHEKKLVEEFKKSKQEGLSSSKNYDKSLKSLKQREHDIMILSKDLKDNKDFVINKWKEINAMQVDITKRQADLKRRIKEDQDRSKGERLQSVLKRYKSMEAANVARSLINSSLDPKLDIPIAPVIKDAKGNPTNKKGDISDDPRVEKAAFYLKEMKATRAAEIMETMGPIWTHALQRRMERSPVADAKKF